MIYKDRGQNSMYIKAPPIHGNNGEFGAKKVNIILSSYTFSSEKNREMSVIIHADNNLICGQNGSNTL